MPIATDTYTDSAATALNAHTPELGGPITQHGSYSAAAVISNANRARAASGAGRRLYYYGATPASADYDVAADLFVATNAANAGAGVAGRINTGADTYYNAVYDQASGQWQLDKVVAGTRTNLGSFSQSLSTSTSYRLLLEMRGTALKVYIDSVERISVTDGDISAAGKGGVSWLGAGSNTASYHLDNYDISDAPAAGGSGLLLAMARNRLVVA